MECPICFETLGCRGAAWYGGPCGHAFHVACLNKSVDAGNAAACPLCRTEWVADAVAVRPVEPKEPVEQEPYVFVYPRRSEVIRARMQRVFAVLSVAAGVVDLASAAAAAVRVLRAENTLYALCAAAVAGDNLWCSRARCLKRKNTMSNTSHITIMTDDHAFTPLFAVPVQLLGAALLLRPGYGEVARLCILFWARAVSTCVYYMWFHDVSRSYQYMRVVFLIYAAFPAVAAAAWTGDPWMALAAAAIAGFWAADRAVNDAVDAVSDRYFLGMYIRYGAYTLIPFSFSALGAAYYFGGDSIV